MNVYYYYVHIPAFVWELVTALPKQLTAWLFFKFLPGGLGPPLHVLSIKSGCPHLNFTSQMTGNSLRIHATTCYLIDHKILHSQCIYRTPTLLELVARSMILYKVAYVCVRMLSSVPLDRGKKSHNFSGQKKDILN